MSDKNSLGRKGVFCSSRVPMVREGREGRVWELEAHIALPCSQEAEKGILVLSEFSLGIPSQMCLQICLLGSSRCCQADSINHHNPFVTSCVVMCKCFNHSEPPASQL